MMRSIKSMMMGGAILLGLAMCLTSCEGTLDDIFGEWSRPTGNNGNTKTTVAVKSVTLDETTLTKAVGDDAVTLTATVDPSDASDKTVTWKSSDASIAAVDANGKVTFEAAGTATITATATNGTEDAADDKTAICEVTISAKKVNVESVKLDKTTLKQTAGDAAVTLTATVTPDDATDKTVKWTSSDENVATVADGVVTFVAAGTATITATAPNGTDDTADDKTAECAVTVKAAAVPVTSVTLDQKMKVLVKGGDALTIKVNFTPTDATDKTVTWESKDPTIASVENGVVTPVGLGITTITAKSGEFSATCEVFVGNVVDLSSEPSDYSASDYDILTGTLSSGNHINILGRKVAFDGMAADNIECFYDVTIYLTDGKTNTVNEYKSAPANVAGIQIGGAGTTLTINAETAGTGILNVTGGDDGAGIGTGWAFSSNIEGGNITINGGVINATGGKWNGGAAGIGTGYARNANNKCGAITINGGVINATGSYAYVTGGAGIGTGGALAITGSTSNQCGAITINGGTVTATGAKSATGIGTGTSYDEGAAANNTCGAITIGSGITSVTAKKGDGAAWCIGKGPGYNSSATTNCGTITIGGVVKAQSDFTGATYIYTPSN